MRAAQTYPGAIRFWLGAALLAAALIGVWYTFTQQDHRSMNEPRGFTAQQDQPEPDGNPGSAGDSFTVQRRLMVERQLRGRDIRDPAVLAAIQRVPRHEFVPERYRDQSYEDEALPIEHRQTISQPYIVALMTQLARPTATSKALDVGTGSGYQAAVLADICRQVYSIEIVEPLASQARERLERLGYENIEVRHGDGYGGWPEQAPFDLIIVAAAPPQIPQPLIDQLAPGGRLVIPVGDYVQHLMVVEKRPDGTVHQWREIPVAFVPMTGEARRRD
jgi:protein-L-isoaspartate(D-aspartate) O-methyltransferase